MRAARRGMLESMIGYCYTTACLRAYILAYFGDEDGARSGAYCGNCSNCKGEFDVVDVTSCARAVMRCVHGLRGRFGKTVRIAGCGDVRFARRTCGNGERGHRASRGKFLSGDHRGDVSDGRARLSGTGGRAGRLRPHDEARPARESGREEGKDRLVRFGFVRRRRPFRSSALLAQAHR